MKRQVQNAVNKTHEENPMENSAQELTVEELQAIIDKKKEILKKTEGLLSRRFESDAIVNARVIDYKKAGIAQVNALIAQREVLKGKSINFVAPKSNEVAAVLLIAEHGCTLAQVQAHWKRENLKKVRWNEVAQNAKCLRGDEGERSAGEVNGTHTEEV